MVTGLIKSKNNIGCVFKWLRGVNLSIFVDSKILKNCIYKTCLVIKNNKISTNFCDFVYLLEYLFSYLVKES